MAQMACDTSRESWAHGAVDRLLFITRALSYFEYKAKRKHGSGAEFPSIEKVSFIISAMFYFVSICIY